MRSLAGLLVLASLALAQTPLCVRDAAGNQVCATLHQDTNVCGYFSMFGRTTIYHCEDFAVERSAGGQPVSRRVFAGNSDDHPAAIFLDARGNAIVTGTTYSSDFPVTADAMSVKYAGPAPSPSSGGPLPAGGDVFLAIVSPAGELLYSTFLGSSLTDTVIGARMASTGEVDLLVGTGGDFPVTGTALAGGPALVSFDPVARKIVRSLFLPIAAAGTLNTYLAAWRDDGDIAVTTPAALFTFTRTGQLRSTTSLASFDFTYVPDVYTDPIGDLWLTGRTRAGRIVVTRFANGVVEAFRWMLPGDGYLRPPLFANGLAYFTGNSLTPIEPTPNAPLRAPCIMYSAGVAAVFSSQGDLKLLTYLPGFPNSLSLSGNDVVATFAGSAPVTLALDARPALVCALDPLQSYTATPFASGQLVRVHGGNFGPASLLTASPDAAGIYPKSLAGYSVEVGGIPAPLLSVSTGEILFAVPFQAPEGPEVLVTLLDHGTRSANIAASLASFAPRLIGGVLNADGTVNSFSNPAPWGSVVIAFVTGAGNSNPPLADGQVAPGPAALQAQVGVDFLVSSAVPEPGAILYAAPAPEIIAGITQVNFQLPPARPYSYLSISPQLRVNGLKVFLPSIYVR